MIVMMMRERFELLFHCHYHPILFFFYQFVIFIDTKDDYYMTFNKGKEGERNTRFTHHKERKFGKKRTSISSEKKSLREEGVDYFRLVLIP